MTQMLELFDNYSKATVIKCFKNRLWMWFSSPLTSSEERFLVTAGWEWEFILLVGLCDTPWEEEGGHIVALQVSTDTGWGMALFLQVMVKFLMLRQSLSCSPIAVTVV